MGRLDGKVAFVSGAARGMGEAEARLFAAEGASVVLGDVLDDEGAIVAKDIGDSALYVHLDVSSEEDWGAAIEATEAAFGPLTVLVNNAGISGGNFIEFMTLDDYLRIVNINQVGVLLGMKQAIPSMTRAGSGSIVNISSVDGLAAHPALSAYVASKFAVRGMTKVAALEVGPRGIRVNSIHPGYIDTLMTRPGGAGTFGVWDASAKLIPIGRVGRSEEVAKAVLFLASDDASYVTGAELVVDGGLMAQVPVTF